MQLNILFEDTQIIVCVKPAGIPTQSKQIGTPDMVSILTNYLHQNNTTKSSSKAPYLALIHRLDQPVEGLLVFAKTPFAAKELNRQLNCNQFQKTYQALLIKSPPFADGRLIDYLLKDSRANLSHVVSSDTKGAKRAELSYKVMDISTTKENTTSVEIQLYTGRHHQIRVQFANIGCPILGDQKY